MKKIRFRRLIILLICILSINLNAQNEEPLRRKVGLVLGGGGAKGAAEVGVM